MRRPILVMAIVFFSMEFMLAFGSSDALAQSLENYYQVTGDEFGHRVPEGFSDSQFSLLWSAYNLKSDSLLAKFFNNWRLETQIVEEPLLETPISNATASLYYFLLNVDFQNSIYPYEYAVIQNQIEATMPSSLWSSEAEYVLRNYHPQSSDPYHPIFIIIDDSHNEMLGDFLGDWSEAKTMAAQQFFGSYVPFGVDLNYSDNQNDWVLIRHWYTFSFSPDLQEASVLDQTPSGNVEYTCAIGQDGKWEKISDGTIEPVPPPEPPPVPPPRPPHPSPPVPIIITPSPPPAPSPKPQGRPRPIRTPTHATSPDNPVQAGRPRANTRAQQNPTSPQTPTQPKRTRTNPPSTNQPTSPKTPSQRPRQIQSPVNTPSSPPPADKKAEDQKKDRQRSQ